MKKIISLALMISLSGFIAGEEKGLFVILVNLDLDESEVEVLIEGADGKLKKLAPEKARAVLKKKEHLVTELVIRDGKLTKVTFKRKPVDVPKPAKKS
jgi:hypothetical protein